MQNNSNQKKVKTARLSVISNSLLIVLKLIAGMVSGSVSIISEAIHSAVDLVAAIIAFFTVKVSDNPPDTRHPYGHGKYENISGVLEAILIFVAAIWIIFEAIEKLIHPSEIKTFGLATAVMLISAGVNWWVSSRLYKVAKETDSLALEADALHLKTDVYTSLGVAIGLGLIYFTNLPILDPIIAIIVALMILKESFHLFKKAFQPLLDNSLPEQDLEVVKKCIDKYTVGCIDYHQLRSRKAGHLRYFDVHLEVPARMTVLESHDLCDKIEADVNQSIPHTEITIHTEPCSQSCKECRFHETMEELKKLNQ